MTFPNHFFLLNMTVASRTKDYKHNYAASVGKIEKIKEFGEEREYIGKTVVFELRLGLKS